MRESCMKLQHPLVLTEGHKGEKHAVKGEKTFAASTGPAGSVSSNGVPCYQENGKGKACMGVL
jgi:hypothetical protein